MPVIVNGQRLAMVAARGHHIDVGGSHPGSMPPAASHIDEEGLRWHNHRLSNAHEMTFPNLDDCRQPEDVRADLQAQVKACQRGVERVQQLIKRIGVERLCRTAAAPLDHAERASRRWQSRNLGQHQVCLPLEEGGKLSLSSMLVEREVSLRLNAPASQSNRNAPMGVLRAAILLCDCSGIQQPIPLNDGSLLALSIEVNKGGLLDPSYPAAVAGGNVETSQRLVDALLLALGRQAESQGTMNNVCITTSAGTLYETIGGGAGASSDGAGGSAVQVHMTNTCATDPELLEHRFPLRLRVCALRPGSGGAGLHHGGNGMIREWELLEPAEVSLLACVAAIGQWAFVAAQWRACNGPGVLSVASGSPWGCIGICQQVHAFASRLQNPSLSATEVAGDFAKVVQNQPPA